MSLFGSVFGYINSGRAAKNISTANMDAMHGVIDATQGAQGRIDKTLAESNTNVTNAGQTAVQQVNDSTTSANSTLQQMLDKQTGNLDPYLSAGKQGVSSLADYAASKPTFSFNPTDLQNDPGYQFQLQQGEQARINSASAQGLGASGSTLKELTKFGQGLAGTYYNDAFNRAKSTFDTNQNTTLANLKALTDVGEFGTGQFNQATTNAGNRMAENTVAGGFKNSDTTTSLAKFLADLNLGGQTQAGAFGMQGARTAGDYRVGAGTANAAGILGQGKAITEGVESLGSLLLKIPGLGGRG